MTAKKKFIKKPTSTTNPMDFGSYYRDRNYKLWAIVDVSKDIDELKEKAKLYTRRNIKSLIRTNYKTRSHALYIQERE